MNDSSTCGQGIAANAPLPAKLGELTDAVATILELHMRALDRSDDAANREHDAYHALAAEHRETAARLHGTAEHMTACRDLPMGRHDMAVMMAPENVEAFARFVALEHETVALLQSRLVQDEAMLAQMRGVNPNPGA